MFEYRRLSSDPVEIRLVEIQEARSSNDPVHLRLYHVPLYSKNVYLALSYTWGSPGAHVSDEWDDSASTLPIWINGEPFQVRRNLESALRHLRQVSWMGQTAWMHQTFWIDAICIDQNFIPERNDQIMRMRDIYSKSIGTIVWLGPATADTHLAVEKIWELFALWNARSEHLKTWPINPEHIEEYAAVLEVEFGDEVSSQVWDAFSDFFKRSWWRRAWVLQEVFAAPDTILFAGDITVPWSAVMHVCHSLTQHTTSEVVAPDIWSSRMRAVNARCQRAVAPASTLHLYHQGAAGDLGSLWGKRDRVLPSIPLIQALRLLRPLSSSDPRDKVHAALGISLNVEAIQPDYSLNVVEVFRNTAVRILESNGDLHILDDCRFPPKRPGCPSWVPDWSDKSRARRQPLPKKGMPSGYKRQQRDQPMYSAGGEDPQLPKIEYNGRILVLQGRVLDTLDFVGTVEQDGTYETDRNPEIPFTEEEWLAEETKVSERNKLMVERVSAFRWLREWAVHQEATGYPYECMKRENWHYQVEEDLSQFNEIRLLPSNATLSGAYISTLAADLMFDADKSSFQRATTEVLQRPISGQFMRSVLSTTLPGRTFAVSQHGFIGLVPEECQSGDIIFIIQGSEVPFILRDVGGVGCFIGECFIHGMMDGEAVEDILASGGFKDIPIV